MNQTEYKTIKEFYSSNTPCQEISEKLRDGWVLLAIRNSRPPAEKDGSFDEVLTYTLGHQEAKW